MLSLRFVMASVAYSALSVATMRAQTRWYVAALAFVTTVWILYAILQAIIGRGARGAFWIGFSVFSFGWFFLNHGYPGREFYSAPATLTEYLAGPDDVYYDRASTDDPNYDGFSSPTYIASDRKRTADRKRLRFIANCIASLSLGLVGGGLGWNSWRRTRTIGEPSDGPKSRATPL